MKLLQKLSLCLSVITLVFLFFLIILYPAPERILFLLGAFTLLTLALYLFASYRLKKKA